MKQKIIEKKIFFIKILTLFFIFSFLLFIFNCNIVFADTKAFTLKEVSIIEKSESTEGNITNNTDSIIDNDIVFHKLNDYVTYKLVISNNTKSQITIKSITDNSTDKYIEYQYDEHKDEKVEPNDTFELIIKTIYKNEQNDFTKRDYINNVDFTITYLDDNNNYGSASINPKTNDDIYTSFVLLIISSVGLIICLLYYKKLNNKKSLKISMFIIAMIAFAPIVVNAATLTITFTLKSNIGLHDKLVVTRVVNGKEETLVYSYGDSVGELTKPNVKGYNFLGWIYEDGADFDSSKPITDDVKVVAKLEKKHYSLVFNNNTNDSSTVGTMENQTGYYGEQTNITSSRFTRSGYKFMGWNTKPDGSGTHYDDNASINLETEGEINLYAEWFQITANLKNGEEINSIISDLNGNITEFKKSSSKPNLDNIDYRIISTIDSYAEVYLWNDNGIMYWWSEADKVYMNSDSNKMFYGLTKLESVDFTSLDSSQMTSMDFMFQYCKSLATMDLRLDTSNVTSMDAMFANCTNLTSVDFSHIDISKVQNFHGLVAGCTKLTNINMNNVNTEGAKSFESMFSTLPNLTEVDLSSFNTPNLESIYFMFLRCTNLNTIYATDKLDVSNVTDTRGALNQATSIVGGAGTVYDFTNAKSVSYFRIDDPDNGKPGYLTLKNARYIRYNSNGADGGDNMTSHYLTTTNPGNLKTNTYTKTGSIFVGWNTKADGSGDSYTDGQLMDTLVASKTPLTLYAQWE